MKKRRRKKRNLLQRKRLIKIASMFVKDYKVLAVYQLACRFRRSVCLPTYHDAQNPRNKDAVNPSQTPIPNLDELDPDKLMAYLTEAGANQTFEDHAKFIMTFANRFRNLDSSDERELLTEKFLVYVVGSSAPKMFHRITRSLPPPNLLRVCRLHTSVCLANHYSLPGWRAPPYLIGLPIYGTLHQP
ncbi:hypothetical protein BD779DRAFT_635203 [Infundibulicybe gibba]|nr:hypothetical protein BD779DRAFT_635203 [Infundibulicybe gibba]